MWSKNCEKGRGTIADEHSRHSAMFQDGPVSRTQLPVPGNLKTEQMQRVFKEAEVVVAYQHLLGGSESPMPSQQKTRISGKN
jgi:hypothetical protein